MYVYSNLENDDTRDTPSLWKR